MYATTFIYATKQFDEDFHRLDQEIAATAKGIPGYLGEETWENKTTGLTSNVYYWESLDALQKLMQHPSHLKAKREQENWLAGYQVVISQVLRMYGDAKLQDRLPVTTAACPFHREDVAAASRLERATPTNGDVRRLP